MKRLKIVLNSKCLYIALTIIISIFVIVSSKLNKDESLIDKNETSFIYVIDNYKIEENKLTLDLKGKEDLIGTIYIKNEQEYKKYIKMLKYGLKVSIKGILTNPKNNTVPNNFNYKKYLNNKNIFYTLKIDNIKIEKEQTNLIYKIKNIIDNKINKIDKKGYIKAFTLGDKSNINQEIYNNYQKIGITHLFALSGMHITLLSTIILKILKKTNIKIKYIIVNLLLIIYGYIVSFPSSIKRCIIFFLINSLNKIFKLNISSFKILLITISIIILNNYKIIYDIAFQYSVITVGGILSSESFIKDNSKLKSSLKLSIVAFLFSMPITLNNYYSINFLSIIYNLFYIPLISIIIYPLSLITLFVNPLYPLLNLSISILETSVFYLSKIDIFVLNLKLELIEILIYYLILIISLKKHSLIIFSFIPVLILLHLFYPYLDSNYYIYFFDVSQGDSSLIMSPHNKNITLIDTGGLVSYDNENNYQVSDEIITFLKSKSINKIDQIILSHGDYDHIGELSNYIDNIKIEKVIFNNDQYNNLEIKMIELLKEKGINYNKRLVTSTSSFMSLESPLFDNENDNSTVIFLKAYNTKILFMGDASIKRENNIISQYKISDVDFVKIGHHGSNTSSSKEFIDYINPKNCVISVGANNKYGHPKKEVLDTLDNYCHIYRTDLNGSIKVKINKNGYKIKTYSP